MKTRITACSIFLILSVPVIAQLPAEQWGLHYGGSGVEVPYAMRYTADGGTVIAGYTSSRDGEVGLTSGRDYWDLWVVKLDKCGQIQWQRSAGGTGYETARDILQTADGGYLVLGETNSTDGGVIAGYGGTKDIWLLKLAPNGNILWQKRYGGSGLDAGNHIGATPDGNYLIVGTTSSNDGDIHGNHSTGTFTDAVFLKVTPDGTLLWSKCFGGSRNDELFDFRILNGNIYAAGYANSTDGDIPPGELNYDVWLLAIDGNGNKIFSKVYGGSQNDVAYAMCVGADQSLTLAGYTTSNDGMVSGARGSQDFWILNVNLQGVLTWQRDAGGSDAEYANAIASDSDGGYLVAGLSYSIDGDITSSHGQGDYWVVKVDAKGNLLWQKSFGGSGIDNLHALVRNPGGNEVYLAGDSDSGDGDFTASTLFGDADFGIIKLEDPVLQSRDSTLCDTSSFTGAVDTVKDVCGYDSLLIAYHPVLLRGPLVNHAANDTIFSGQRITLPYDGNGTPVWNGDPSLSCLQCANPVATPAVTTRYTVTSSVPHGCEISGSITVVVLQDVLVAVPDAFTPNNDGLNDYFGPLGKAPQGFSLRVFNRFGQPVFASSPAAEKWDGTLRGAPQPEGVYVYLLSYIDTQNTPRQLKGTVTLLR